jgi:hypothetical protein
VLVHPLAANIATPSKSVAARLVTIISHPPNPPVQVFDTVASGSTHPGSSGR